MRDILLKYNNLQLIKEDDNYYIDYIDQTTLKQEFIIKNRCYIGQSKLESILDKPEKDWRYLLWYYFQQNIDKATKITTERKLTFCELLVNIPGDTIKYIDISFDELKIASLGSDCEFKIEEHKGGINIFTEHGHNRVSIYNVNVKKYEKTHKTILIECIGGLSYEIFLK